MIKPYIQKIFFVDDNFFACLKEISMKEYTRFIEKELDTEIVSLPAADDAMEGLLSVVDPQDIRVGNVLIRARYSDQFFTIEDFSDSAALNKFLHWQSVCIALGAKSVSVKSVEFSLIEDQLLDGVNVNGSVGIPVAKVDADLVYTLEKRSEALKSKMVAMEARAAGGIPDLARAEDIMKRTGLFRDSLFKSLYDMRALTSNQLLSQSFMLDMTSDVKNAFNSSTNAKLSTMVKIFKGNLDMSFLEKSINSSREAVKVTVSVEF